MKKRIVSILLTFCMVLGLLPISAFAAEIPSGYTDGGDVSTSGLYLTTTTTVNTYFKAGDGYILWEPVLDSNGKVAGGKVTLNSATISANGNALRLPNGDVTLVVSGVNDLQSTDHTINQSMEGAATIKGGGTLNLTSSGSNGYGIFCSNGAVTITEDVVVNTAAGEVGIFGSDGITISGNARVTDSGSSYSLYSKEDIAIDTAGTVNAPFISARGIFKHTNGTITGSLVCQGNGSFAAYAVYSVYGSLTLDQDRTIGSEEAGNKNLTIPSGATLTINSGVTLTIESGVEVTNNGTIAFPADTTAATIQALNITGSGTVKAGDKTFILLNGTPYLCGDVGTSGLNLSTNTPTVVTAYKAGTGYILWTPASGDNPATVTLQDATVNSPGGYGLVLPNDIDITIVVEGKNSLQSLQTAVSKNNGNITIQGSGTLNAQGSANYDGIFCPNDLAMTGNVSVSASNIWSSTGTITVNTIGTITVPKIYALDTFAYKKGTMTGSWVTECNGDENNDQVPSVYGNVTLSEDETIETTSGKNCLTIASGSTLTIPSGKTLTVESGVAITNNGTLVNNGTIDLPAETTAAQITAMNLRGTVTVGGKSVVIVNGVLCSLDSDVSSTGLDLSTNTPTVVTAYKAGNGYILYDPAAATLTMNNATINKDQAAPLIKLPTKDVTVTLVGDSTLTNLNDSKDDFVSAIQQGDVISASGLLSPITAGAYKLTAMGSGSLLLRVQKDNAISTDGTFVMKSGTIKSASDSMGFFDFTTTDFKMEGGTLLLYGNMQICGNAVMTGGFVTTPGGNDGGILACVGDFNMSGGTVKCGAGNTANPMVIGTFRKTGGTLNALVGNVVMSGSKITLERTVYGNATLEKYDKNSNVAGTVDIMVGNLSSGGNEISFNLNIPQNNTLTIPYGVTMEVSIPEGKKLSDYCTNNGTLINNGTISLPADSTAEEVLAAVAVLKPTGMGLIQVGSKVYSNSGDEMKLINTPLDFSDGKPKAELGYEFSGDKENGYTLTFNNLLLENSLTLPTNASVTIRTNSTSVITGNISFSGGYGDHITFKGSKFLTINGSLNANGSPSNSVTVDGAKLHVEGSITVYGSGNNGDTEVFQAINGASVYSGDGVSCSTVLVSGNSQLTSKSNSCAVTAKANGGNGGNVTVTGGSTLTVGCDYGVYIIGGKLTVDSTSKLITNATIAPFCIVDKTNSKTPSDVLSLSSTPSGTVIANKLGTKATYWSLAPTGGTLSVSNENSEPVTLSGAATGSLTFVKAANPNPGNGGNTSVSGGGSGGGGGSSTISYNITATASTGGAISPSGSVSVTTGSSKTFTITANDGYTVKAVLVDGVSVGAVTTYTFEKVTKVHTITVSFANKTDSPYSDVQSGDWFNDAVDYVTQKGLFSGISSTAFGPNESMTRAMLWTVLYRQAGSPVISDSETVWYGAARKWVMENDISDGVDPNGKVTREQLAAILYRYAQFKGYDTTQGSMAVREFSDYDQISNWALEAMAWAVNTDLISGKGNGVLDPHGRATRAQVATILMRYCKNIAK